MLRRNEEKGQKIAVIALRWKNGMYKAERKGAASRETSEGGKN